MAKEFEVLEFEIRFALRNKKGKESMMLTVEKLMRSRIVDCITVENKNYTIACTVSMRGSNAKIGKAIAEVIGTDKPFVEHYPDLMVVTV